MRKGKSAAASKHLAQSRILFVRTKSRNEHGWSLAATLLMMIVITLFVAAMWGSLLPAYLNVAGLRYKDVSRALDEGSVDQLLAQVNNQALAPPAGYLQAATSTRTQSLAGAQFTITSTVTNMGNTPPLNSVVFNPVRPNTDAFMMVSSKVQQGLMKKTITVLLSPIENVASNPYQYGPAFGVTTVNEVGQAGVNGYNLPAGWNNPYQFADTTVASGVTWQIGNGPLGRGSGGGTQLIAGSQFEFWQPGQQPSLPSGTIPLTYEPFTQIMGNVYSNYTAQSGANGNGYWMRNQTNDYSSAVAPGGSTSNANVFGAANGLGLTPAGTLSTSGGAGVPTGFESGNTSNSIPIPPLGTQAGGLPSQPGNGSGSTVNSGWGFNGQAGNTGYNMPQVGSTDGGAAFKATPYTGGYITAPGPGQAGALDNWVYPPPTVQNAPGAPVGAPSPATGGLGVPNGTGTWFASAPQSVVVNGGTLNITNSAGQTPPNSLSVSNGQTVNIPPGNYNLSSLQVVNGGKITIDPSVQGQTQIFLTPAGNGQGTSSAVYVDNKSSINMTGISGTGFTTTGITGYGKAGPNDQLAVDTAHPIQETSGSALNLQFVTNANCNMLFAGNARALVNAPNANVNVGYQPNPNNSHNYTSNSQNDPSAVMANDANFYGAIVAGNVSIVSDYSQGAGAYLHYDVNLKRISTQPGQQVAFGKALGWYDPWTFKSPQPPAPNAKQWRAVTWIEQ